MDRRQSSARCELARGRFARAHKSGSVVRRSDGDSLRAFSLREICCPTKAESPSDRQKTRIHSTAKSGRRNGQPQGCSLRSERLRRLKPLTPTLTPAVHSALPSMLHCCTSDLNRRRKNAPEILIFASSSNGTPSGRLKLVAGSVISVHRPVRHPPPE